MNNTQLDMVLEYLDTGIINEGLFDKFKKKGQGRNNPQKPKIKTLLIDQIEDEELKEQAKNIDKAIIEANKPFKSGKYDSQIKKLVKDFHKNQDYNGYDSIDEFIKWEIGFDDIKIIDKSYNPNTKEVIINVDLAGISQDGYFAIIDLLEEGPYQKAIVDSLRKNKITRFKEIGFADDTAGYTIILK